MDNRLVTERVQCTVTEMKLVQTVFSDFWKKRFDKCQGGSFVADLSELVYWQYTVNIHPRSTHGQTDSRIQDRIRHLTTHFIVHC